eukprot:TRINITY_DN1630_c0_g1_i6.p1 TRINITY_DN1630_c0_g1~~TRINITY_DN1630_c0_g1_i6.p1  ORF type:complete len:796 (+),score=128.86 TRINITY_DN1630_c0_g1_i6:31-2388(+)
MHRTLVGVVSVALAASQTVPVTTKAYDTRACRPGMDHFKFCDTTLSKEQRLDDLLSQITPDEIIPFLTARIGQDSMRYNNITRLGVPHYDWGLNCIHGVQSSCVNDTKTGKTYCPTYFPDPVNLGASFNRSMWRTMGEMIGVEARAFWLAGAVEPSPNTGRPHIGLDCWSPNININHDPRWGRNQEVASEDPFVNGLFGSMYTKGQQESKVESRFLQGITTLKHWDAYTLEDSDGYSRHNFSAVLDNPTISDTFFPAWKESIVNGKAMGVMCSYNAINNVPTCASPFLTNALRNVWNFTGYVTSDSGAVRDIYANHKYVETPEEAACAAIRDGQCDIDSGSVYNASLLDGVKQGHCDMYDVHRGWKHAMGLLFDMGLFDPADDQPLWKVPLSAIGTESSLRAALQSAQESMVLLKNQNGLPAQTGKKYALVGPHYQAQAANIGSYRGQVCPDNTFDCIETLESALSRVSKGSLVSAQGCSMNSNDTSGFAAALALVDSSVDTVFLAIGLDDSVSNEGHDRLTGISLPGVQAEFTKQVLAKAASVSKPVVIVLINGGMVSLGNEAISSSSAIVEAFYPGMFGSEAIATTLFGENPYLGGKMPYTVYPADYVNEIKMSDMSMNKKGTPGRSYKYYTGPTEFDFGFGLAYTTFEFQAAKPAAAPTCDDHRSGDSVSVLVKNTGLVTGDNVLFLYVLGGYTGSGGLPLQKKLHNFERVHLAAGEQRTVQFELSSDHFLNIEDNGDHTCTPGTRTIRISDGVNHQDIDIVVGGSKTTAFTFPDVPPRKRE